MPLRKPKKPAPPRRRRFPADEARARILAAAERKLTEVGPERLRLTDLAAELGISHQAILHHFGTREDLLSALLDHAIERINRRLADAISGPSPREPGALLDIAADFYGTEGSARLLAWLVLSENGPRLQVATEAARPLQPLVALMHGRRKKAMPGRIIELAETRFLCQLAAFALLGEALFGDLIRVSYGAPADVAGSRDFRLRLARLLTDAS